MLIDVFAFDVKLCLVNDELIRLLNEELLSLSVIVICFLIANAYALARLLLFASFLNLTSLDKYLNQISLVLITCYSIIINIYCEL